MTETRVSTSHYPEIPLIAEGLFRPGPPAILLGGRHMKTGKIVFPCPSGLASEDYESIELGSEGVLWSWTIQRFRPKSPPYAGSDPFEPFALGYVEIPGKVIVESRLVNLHFDKIRSGIDLRLTTVVFPTDNGPKLIYAFEPTEPSHA